MNNYWSLAPLCNTEMLLNNTRKDKLLLRMNLILADMMVSNLVRTKVCEIP